MKKLALLLVLLAGCGEKEITKTVTVQEGVKIIHAPAPTGVITQDQCVHLTNHITLREVLDRYGWPHTQDLSAAFERLIVDNEMWYPFTEDSESYCSLHISTNQDPDKSVIDRRTITLK